MKNNKIWTLEKVKEGFEKFYRTYNRYPTAYDIDDFNFLPSSRQIQRSFGGLVKLRKILELKIENYGNGKSRSRLAHNSNILGKKCERIVLELLKNKFDEKFVHIEKPVEGDYKNRFDFYVYAKPKNFAIDVFGSDDTRNLVNNFNIKEKKYLKSNNEKESLYFIYIGDKINESKLAIWYQKKKSKIPKNWKIISLKELKKEMNRYEAYRAI